MLHFLNENCLFQRTLHLCTGMLGWISHRFQVGYIVKGDTASFVKRYCALCQRRVSLLGGIVWFVGVCVCMPKFVTKRRSAYITLNMFIWEEYLLPTKLHLVKEKVSSSKQNGTPLKESNSLKGRVLVVSNPASFEKKPVCWKLNLFNIDRCFKMLEERVSWTSSDTRYLKEIRHVFLLWSDTTLFGGTDACVCKLCWGKTVFFKMCVCVFVCILYTVHSTSWKGSCLSDMKYIWWNTQSRIQDKDPGIWIKFEAPRNQNRWFSSS